MAGGFVSYPFELLPEIRPYRQTTGEKSPFYMPERRGRIIRPPPPSLVGGAGSYLTPRIPVVSIHHRPKIRNASLDEKIRSNHGLNRFNLLSNKLPGSEQTQCSGGTDLTKPHPLLIMSALRVLLLSWVCCDGELGILWWWPSVCLWVMHALPACLWIWEMKAY